MTKTMRAVPIEIKFNEIQSNVDIVPTDVQVLRVGAFYHPVYGKVEITKETLSKMKENFDKNVRKIDIAIDYKHESEDIAAGWIRQVHLYSEGMELWATVQWTPNGKRVLHDKEFRYLSADFDFNYKDNETLEEYGATLLGAGLTNRPVVKGMTPAVHLQETERYSEDDQMNVCVAGLVPQLIAEGKPKDQAIAIAFSKCQEKMAGLTSNNANNNLQGGLEMNAEEMQKKITDLETQLSAIKTERDTLLSEKEVAEKAKLLAEKEGQFNKLLSEGKAVPAQKEAFMSGDTVKFAELAKPVKLGQTGTETQPTTESKDPVEEVMALAEKKISEKKASNLGSAISMVLHENKELRARYEAAPTVTEEIK